MDRADTSGFVSGGSAVAQKIRSALRPARVDLQDGVPLETNF
ncbi:unnamed protein product [Spirodela intermedia]|uniref:Uncharacterized protein n=2 Tax=Spirodela intermedia TaxID=51605 RepID=A0A7I8KXR4_SPIIN|nr:unnamed protein product [Spirodela intermedia]CAA6665135.1 unnamed protein product [Spirodela intermedia]CAA7401858.1 unnamed protein product [Spirodela intermedia]